MRLIKNTVLRPNTFNVIYCNQEKTGLECINDDRMYEGMEQHTTYRAEWWYLFTHFLHMQENITQVNIVRKTLLLEEKGRAKNWTLTTKESWEECTRWWRMRAHGQGRYWRMLSAIFLKQLVSKNYISQAVLLLGFNWEYFRKNTDKADQQWKLYSQEWGKN